MGASRCVSNAPNGHVKEGGDSHADAGGRLELPGLSWAFQRVLYGNER